MNGFEKHNIDHLSASSINLWTNAPDVWVAKYLLDHKQQFGPAPRRGQCVETAADMILKGTSEKDALTHAFRMFDDDFDLMDEGADKERALIEPMVEIAVSELEQYGRPKDTGGNQERIEISANFEDWSIPVIGFLDFEFEDHGLVVDLKTTTRVPSTMSADHQLQRAIYACAKGNAAVKFLYVSAKKANWLEDGDTREVLARAKVQIARLERFLSLHSTDEMRACVPCNPNSFYWRGDEAARKEIYGL